MKSKLKIGVFTSISTHLLDLIKFNRDKFCKNMSKSFSKKLVVLLNQKENLLLKHITIT